MKQIISKKSAKLPVWDLSDLYLSPDDKALEADLISVDRESQNFHKKYHNKIKQMEGAELANTIALYEKIDEKSKNSNVI